MKNLIQFLTVSMLRFADLRMINGRTLYPETKVEELQRVLGFTKQEAESCVRDYK